MFSQHDPSIGNEQPSWPAPAGSPPVLDIDPPTREALRVRSGRRRLALAAVAVLTIAGGTVGGALAGRNSQTTVSSAPATSTSSTTSSTSGGGFNNASVAPSSPDKEDVSALISKALPGVVSISVELNGGQAAGTGFVISSDGQIATNAHVVADATKIEVKFSDGSTAAATVLGVDRTDDLAVVKVDKAGLTALPLGKSADLRIGEPVVAIGNALDLTGGPTATEGIVSAIDRTIDTSEGEHLTHLLQTDAAINPGNSGGPLLTLDGEVVGINSAGSQDAQNIGFAIAIDTARPIVEQLQQGKTITKAYLGVSTTVIDPAVSAQDGLAVNHGLLVVDVAGDSAASAAGIQPGDVIVSINGTATDDNTTLGDVIRTAGTGHVVHLKVFRNGKTIDIDATLSTHAA
jgi:S1-C subfamily serine protease